jgi:hypothetical protein
MFDLTVRAQDGQTRNGAAHYPLAGASRLWPVYRRGDEGHCSFLGRDLRASSDSAIVEPIKVASAAWRHKHEGQFVDPAFDALRKPLTDADDEAVKRPWSFWSMSSRNRATGRGVAGAGNRFLGGERGLLG